MVLLESMYLRKPTIATNYSGNTDFTNSQTSFPVNYSLVKLKNNIGSYKKGNQWAEPDLENAAWQLTRVFNQEVLRLQIAKAGQAYI